jgi:hypothetical protein
MHDDDVERALGAFEPRAPRPGLRDEVLQRVGETLANTGRLDRWLALPRTWAAAAAVLLTLGGAVFAVDRAHASRLRSLGVVPDDARSAAEMQRALVLRGDVIATVGSREKNDAANR